MSGEIKDVELARPGLWELASGKTRFTLDHLKDAAAYFKATGNRAVPLKIGHTDPRFVGDGEPAFGWLKNVRYEEDDRGPVLLGDLADMPRWLHAAVPKRWPNRSIEGWQNVAHEGRTYKLILSALALLGVQPPGIPTIRSLSDLQLAVAASGAQRIVATATKHLNSPGGEMTIDGPWAATGQDPVDWAVSTGRLAASSARSWRADMRRDPETTAHWLTTIQPIAGVDPEFAHLWGQHADPVNAAAEDAEFAHLFPPDEFTRRAQEAAQVLADDGRVYDDSYGPTTVQEESSSYVNFVEELRSAYPIAVAIAEAAQAPPELFPGGGDYPPFTVSGVDPSILEPLPWRAALVGMWTEDRGEVMRIVRDYGGPDGEQEAQLRLDDHPLVREHVGEVRSWYSTAGVGRASDLDELQNEEMARLFPPRR